ncbi:MAG: MvdC/MvdD family ATP grasp protein [Planctomycetota bacterium]
MLLILTNSQDATANYLCPILSNEGIDYQRLDTDRVLDQAQLGFTDVQPWLEIEGVRLRPDEIHTIWLRRPERLRKRTGSEDVNSDFAVTEWTAALEGYLAHVAEERWVNHAAANAHASSKIRQLTLAASLGLRVPESVVTQSADVARQLAERWNGRIIAKPLSSAAVSGSDGSRLLIFTNDVGLDDLEEDDCLAACPTLFQERIQKAIDVRVTVIDGNLHPVGLRAGDAPGNQRTDIRRNNMVDVIYESVTLPDGVRRRILELMSIYRLRFAAIDMAVSTEGEWVFFEVNPNGQWAWMDLAGATSIADSFLKSFSQT